MRTVKTRIFHYLLKWYRIDPNHWVHKDDIEQKVKGAGFLAETGNRTLRKMVEEGTIERRLVGKAKSCEYRFIELVDTIKEFSV